MVVGWFSRVLVLPLTLTGNLSLILPPLPKPRRSQDLPLPWVWSQSVLLINMTSCFPTVRKEEGSKVWGEWRGAAPKEDLSRDESLLKLSQSHVFFLLNDSQAKANQPEIGANSSLPFVSFRWVGDFCFCFPISLHFPWKQDCAVFIPGWGPPLPVITVSWSGGVVISKKYCAHTWLWNLQGYLKCYSYSLHFLCFLDSSRLNYKQNFTAYYK